MRQLTLLLLLITVHSWGQSIGQSAPLYYKDCSPERLTHVPQEDTVRQCAIIDSVSKLMAGRWELAEEGAGACVVSAHAPAHTTHIILNQQGEGKLLVNGSPEARFQLLLSYYWSNVHFAMVQNGFTNYFRFLPPLPPNYRKRPRPEGVPDMAGYYRNVLRVCEETLVLSGPVTGLSYVFRRVAKE